MSLQEIYEYIFQKLSLLYRGEEEINPDNLYNYLKILYTLLDDTENIQKPNNYFACSGHGQFIFDYSFNNDKKNDLTQINIGYSFSIMINFKLSKCGIKNMNIWRLYENIVAIELLRRWYELYIWVLYDKEIDFVAIKQNEKIYIQVSSNIEEENTFNREITPLLKIKDAYPKVLIARTKQPYYQYEWIQIFDIADWLAS